MATEEIELNRRLEEDYADLGLEIVETDLGEWIAQLAGDTSLAHRRPDPAHERAHGSRRYSPEAAGEELPPDVEAAGQLRPQPPAREVPGR